MGLQPCSKIAAQRPIGVGVVVMGVGVLVVLVVVMGVGVLVMGVGPTL